MMKTTALTITGSKDGEVELPLIFSTPFRAELIHKAFTNLTSHKFQRQGRHPTAGMDVVARSNDPPTGQHTARIAKMKGGGGGRQGQAGGVASPNVIDACPNEHATKQYILPHANRVYYGLDLIGKLKGIILLVKIATARSRPSHAGSTGRDGSGDGAERLIGRLFFQFLIGIGKAHGDRLELALDRAEGLDHVRVKVGVLARYDNADCARVRHGLLVDAAADDGVIHIG